VREFKRFKAEPNSVRARVKVPFVLKNRVEVFFHKWIRYEKGIRLTDAYIYCLQECINCHLNDADFFNDIIGKELYKEDVTGEESMIILPRDVSNGIDMLKDVMRYNNKQKTIISCIGVGITLFEKQMAV